MKLSKFAQKQVDQINALLTAGHNDIAARCLSAFHRAGNRNEQKAADEIRTAHSIMCEYTAYVNGAMISKC